LALSFYWLWLQISNTSASAMNEIITVDTTSKKDDSAARLLPMFRSSAKTTHIITRVGQWPRDLVLIVSAQFLTESNEWQLCKNESKIWDMDITENLYISDSFLIIKQQAFSTSTDGLKLCLRTSNRIHTDKNNAIEFFRLVLSWYDKTNDQVGNEPVPEPLVFTIMQRGTNIEHDQAVRAELIKRAIIKEDEHINKQETEKRVNAFGSNDKNMRLVLPDMVNLLAVDIPLSKVPLPRVTIPRKRKSENTENEKKKKKRTPTFSTETGESQ
jgi:hypothetical protein